MPPFEYRPAVNPYAPSIGEILLHGGDAAARAAEVTAAARAHAAEVSGNAWGGAVQQSAQQIGAIPGQIAQQQRVSQEDQLRGLSIEDAKARFAQEKTQRQAQAIVDSLPYYASGQGRDSMLAALDGPARTLAEKHYGDLDTAAANLAHVKAETEALGTNTADAQQKLADAHLDYMGTLANGVKQNNYDPKSFFMAAAHAYGAGAATAQEAGHSIAYALQHPEWIKSAIDEQIAASPQQQTLQRQQKAADAAAANTAADNARADLAEQRAEAAAAETGRHNLAMEKRPVGGAAAGAAATAADDVKESVAGMKEGTIPPQLPGRASKEYTATMAEAHRQGYDLVGAVTDWNATQKHIASLNSNAQLKLNQSINALPELLDSVDTLASKWKGGKFPPLNRANLALAKNGIYGEDVASVARQLDSQIADVTADLGAVYMGGNSPTDHALELAGKSLSGDWSEKVLHDMVTLARGNVKIRSNSIRNTGVAGASADNPYAPKPVVAPSAGGPGPVGAPTYQDYLNSRKAKP